MSGQMFCPSCGVQRTGPACTNCGYDYVEGAKTPAITLSRGINWVSLIVGGFALAVVGIIVFWLVS